MSSESRSSVVVNLDVEPLGSPEPPPAPPPAPPAQEQHPAAGPIASPVKAATRTRNVVTRDVAAHRPKSVEQAARPQETLPAPVSLQQPQVRRPGAVTPRVAVAAQPVARSTEPAPVSRIAEILAPLPPAEAASFGYVARSDLFDAVADQVADRLTRDEPPLTFEKAGHATSETSRFGLELEFVFEPEDTMEEFEAELELIDPGPWTVERKSTDDETLTLSSPLLRDDAVSWYGLERVLEALRWHGGATIPGTAARLRIEAAGFAESVEHRQALMSLVAVYQHTLHRLAGDPTGFVPTPAWQEPTLEPTGIALVPPWSSVLDAAILQARIRIWLGLVGAAAALAPPMSPTGQEPTDQPVLYPKDRPLISGRIAVYRPGSPADTLAARSLIDTALSSRADREQAAALYHITPSATIESDRIHVRMADLQAYFGHASPPLAQHHAEQFGEDAFITGLDLDPRHGVPIVYEGDGSASFAQPSYFAELLLAAGWLPTAPVLLWVEPAALPDPAALTEWIRELARAVDAPVYLGLDGARLVTLSDAALKDFTLHAEADEVSQGFCWIGVHYVRRARHATARSPQGV